MILLERIRTLLGGIGVGLFIATIYLQAVTPKLADLRPTHSSHEIRLVLIFAAMGFVLAGAAVGLWIRKRSAR